jgi:hypothetical protein
MDSGKLQARCTIRSFVCAFRNRVREVRRFFILFVSFIIFRHSRASRFLFCCCYASVDLEIATRAFAQQTHVDGLALSGLSSREAAQEMFCKMGVQQRPSRVFYAQLQKLKETLTASMTTDMLIDTVTDLGTQLLDARRSLKAEEEAVQDEKRRIAHLSELAERRRQSSRKYSQQLRRIRHQQHRSLSNSSGSGSDKPAASSPSSDSCHSESEPSSPSLSPPSSDSDYVPDRASHRDGDGRFDRQYCWQMFLLIVALRSLGIAAHAIADTVSAVKGICLRLSD